MDEREDREALARLKDETRWRPYRVREPARMGDVLAQLMAKRGYAQERTLAEQERVWNEVIGPELSAETRAGLVRKGVLEVFVASSTLLQELTFRKRELLDKLSAKLPDRKIRDLKFRVGSG